MIHAGLTSERWNAFSLVMQMANVGADIDRTVRWRDKGDHENSQLAIYRALELLDLTIIDPKNKGGNRKELARLRELLKDYFLCGNEYQVLDDTFLYNYFMDFGYAAALERGR